MVSAHCPPHQLPAGFRSRLSADVATGHVAKPADVAVGAGGSARGEGWEGTFLVIGMLFRGPFADPFQSHDIDKIDVAVHNSSFMAVLHRGRYLREYRGGHV